MYMIIGLVSLALIIFALVDLITSDNSLVKHLPKIMWVFVILLLPVVGSIVWLLVGKERSPLTGGWGALAEQNQRDSIESRLTTEQEMVALDREIEFHEKQARVQRLEAELETKRQERSQP